MQLNSTCGLSTEKEGAGVQEHSRCWQRCSEDQSTVGTCSPWRLLGCFSSPKAIHLQIPLITVLHRRSDKDGGGAVYHFMFSAVPREKRLAHSRPFSLFEQVSLPPEEGHRVKASFLRGGHRIGTHSRSGFPKWGVGPSLQAPLKPCRLLSVQDKELLTCQHLAGRDLLLSFRINFLVQIL